MSNPLIKSNDPRFVRPTMVDGEGKNRFGDDQQAAEQAAEQVVTGTEVQQRDMYSVTAASQDRPYQPRYETTAAARGLWLLVLAVVGVAGVGTSALSLGGLATGWIFARCGTVAATAAWLLAYSDLQEMTLGSRDPEGRPLTLFALWLGVFGMFTCLATVAAMIWIGLSFLPNIL
jgi:hypothetical protein